MKKTTEKYVNNLKEDLLDPVEAAEYLNAALEDGSQEVFLLALKDVANAKGISEIAKDTNLNRENLYRILSTQGNPKLKSLNSVLHSIALNFLLKWKTTFSNRCGESGSSASVFGEDFSASQFHIISNIILRTMD